MLCDALKPCEIPYECRIGSIFAEKRVRIDPIHPGGWKVKSCRFYLLKRSFAFYGLCVFTLFLATEKTYSVPDVRADENDLFTAQNPAIVFKDNPIRLSTWLVPLDESEMTGHDETSVETIQQVSARSASHGERFSITNKGFLWRDTARRRSIPVRIYYPLSQRDEKFPVIVFSHGLGGSIDCCSYLATAWASRGFVVVMLQHPGSDENVWKGKVRILHELQEAYRYNWSGRTRALDIRFVLDRLEFLDGQGDWLTLKMDLQRIGAGGYDLGCLASLLVAGQLPPDGGASLYDPRIKAVLAMSPPVNGPSRNFKAVYAPISAPVFFVTGTEDDGIVGSTKAHQRRIPFDSLGATDRYLVTMRGADHRVYGGRILSIRARNDKPFQSLIVRASSCFWQARLQENETALAVLNGYGLNSMLGGSAYLERRVFVGIRNEDQVRTREMTTVSEKLPIPEKQTGTEMLENRESTFPLTRIYRVVNDKYALRPEPRNNSKAGDDLTLR